MSAFADEEYVEMRRREFEKIEADGAEMIAMATTTKATHTPGPWGIDVSMGLILAPPAKGDTEHLGRVVARVGEPRNHWERPTADQHLIAAAPDLLEQLEALCVQIKAAGLFIPPGVVAAIAAARGAECPT